MDDIMQELRPQNAVQQQPAPQKTDYKNYVIIGMCIIILILLIYIYMQTPVTQIVHQAPVPAPEVKKPEEPVNTQKIAEKLSEDFPEPKEETTQEQE